MLLAVTVCLLLVGHGTMVVYGSYSAEDHTCTHTFTKQHEVGTSRGILYHFLVLNSSFSVYINCIN